MQQRTEVYSYQKGGIKCFTFPTVIYTEGKCIRISSRKFENFELFCPLGAMKLGVQQKKLPHLIQPSQDPTYIYFFLIQGLRVRVEMGTKSEKVCMCVCVYVCDAFLLASISPYISKVHGHFWLKFGMVPSIYGALMLLNFCGDRGRGLGARTKLLGVSN